MAGYRKNVAEYIKCLEVALHCWMVFTISSYNATSLNRNETFLEVELWRQHKT